MDQQLDAKIALIETVIKKCNDGHPEAEPFVVGPQTTEEEFRKVVDDKSHDLRSRDLVEIYKNVRIMFYSGKPAFTNS